MRVLGLDFGVASQAACAALLGVITGCGLWLALTVSPRPVQQAAAASAKSAAAPVTPSTRLGELLISAPSFGAAPVALLAPAAGLVVPSPASDLRVMGIARARGEGRALLSSSGQDKPRWIPVGDCDAGVCVNAIGRSSVVVTIGGERRVIDIFRQGGPAKRDLPVVAVAAPSPSPQTSAGPSPSVVVVPSATVEPTITPSAVK